MANNSFLKNCGNCKFWDKDVKFWDSYYHGCKLSKEITYKFYTCSKQEKN